MSNYALYAYLSLKLCSTMDDVNTFLKTSIYEPDIAHHFEGFDDKNIGIKNRREFFGATSGENFAWSTTDQLLVGQLVLPLPKLSLLIHPCQVSFPRAFHLLF